ADLVTRLAPQGRAERAGVGTGHVVVVDAADAADARTVPAPAPGTDLLHDRRRGAGHRDVVVVHVGDAGTVHGDHAQPRLARAGDGDVREPVVGEVTTRLRAEHQRVAADRRQVRVDHDDVAVGQGGAQRPVALEDQRVVVGGDGDVGDEDVTGADDVPAVAVAGRVDGQVIGEDVVAAVDEHREVPAAAQREAAADHQPVAAGQRDELVGLAGPGVAGDEGA